MPTPFLSQYGPSVLLKPSDSSMPQRLFLRLDNKLSELQERDPDAHDGVKAWCQAAKQPDLRPYWDILKELGLLEPTSISYPCPSLEVQQIMQHFRVTEDKPALRERLHYLSDMMKVSDIHNGIKIENFNINDPQDKSKPLGVRSLSITLTGDVATVKITAPDDQKWKGEGGWKYADATQDFQPLYNNIFRRLKENDVHASGNVSAESCTFIINNVKSFADLTGKLSEAELIPYEAHQAATQKTTKESFRQ